jgi:GTP-binding protein EngB required for normal cell division
MSELWSELEGDPATSDLERRLEIANHLQDYLGEGDSLKILVAGKMGVGKSSLINSIYGAQLTVEESSAAAVTSEIISYTSNVPTPCQFHENQESTITFWDSPGFGDVFATNQSKIIEELKFVVDKAHILVYCFDIRGRLTRDDVEGIVEMTKQVSHDIWVNAVFALNFSNDLRPPREDMDPIQFFGNAFKSWHQQITRVLREAAGVPDRIVDNISITACGYQQKQPPGFRNWYTSFWTTVFEKMREDGVPMFLKLTYDRCVDNRIPDLSEPEPSPTCSPHALKVQLFGKRECPGVVTPFQPFPDKKVNGNTRLEPLQSHDTSSGPPSVDELAVRIDDLIQPGWLSGTQEVPDVSSAQLNISYHPPVQQPPVQHPPPGQPRTEQPPTGQPPPEQPPPPPEQPPPEQPPPPDQPSRKKKILKGLGGVGGALATGTVVGALVGIAGGPIGIGAGAVGGAVVGTTIGVIALIAMKLGKYIKKKKRDALLLTTESA